MDNLKKLERNGVHLEYDDIARLCEKYMISELSVFGSSIRDDFTADSDVDILITYKPEAEFVISLFDEIALQGEIQKLLNREVDLCDKDCLTNPIRRKYILSTSEVIYAAQ